MEGLLVLPALGEVRVHEQQPRQLALRACGRLERDGVETRHFGEDLLEAPHELQRPLRPVLFLVGVELREVERSGPTGLARQVPKAVREWIARDPEATTVWFVVRAVRADRTELVSGLRTELAAATAELDDTRDQLERVSEELELTSAELAATQGQLENVQAALRTIFATIG